MRTFRPCFFKSILTLFVIFGFIINIRAENKDIPILPTKPKQSDGRDRAPFHCPLTVTLDTSELLINFLSSIGIATITVIDESDSMVYLSSIDTQTNTSLNIPVDWWDEGDYRIRVSYGSVILEGKLSL